MGEVMVVPSITRVEDGDLSTNGGGGDGGRSAHGGGGGGDAKGCGGVGR